MGKGSRNRTKGHNAERYYAKIFKDLGYSHCVTSRYGSRLHDDAGIDLINLPINVQIKAGSQRGMNVGQTLKEIKERLSKMFPENSVENTEPLILIHRKDVSRGKKREDTDDIVSMTFDDFLKLFNKWD